MLYSLLLIINHSSILPLMALNSLYCADVPLSNYSLTHSLTLKHSHYCYRHYTRVLHSAGTEILESVRKKDWDRVGMEREPVKMTFRTPLSREVCADVCVGARRPTLSASSCICWPPTQSFAVVCRARWKRCWKVVGRSPPPTLTDSSTSSVPSRRRSGQIPQTCPYGDVKKFDMHQCQFVLFTYLVRLHFSHVPCIPFRTMTLLVG